MQNCFPAGFCSLSWCLGLLLSRNMTLHFTLLNFKSFFSTHFSNLLRSLSAICCINHFSQFYIICKLAGSALCCIIQVINKDVKQNLPQCTPFVTGCFVPCSGPQQRLISSEEGVSVQIFTCNFNWTLAVWFCQDIALANNAPKFYLYSRSWGQSPNYDAHTWGDSCFSNLVYHYLISLVVNLFLSCHSHFKILLIRLVSLLAKMVLSPLVRWILSLPSLPWFSKRESPDHRNCSPTADTSCPNSCWHSGSILRPFISLAVLSRKNM